jgi:hypothetical protein
MVCIIRYLLAAQRRDAQRHQLRVAQGILHRSPTSPQRIWRHSAHERDREPFWLLR